MKKLLAAFIIVFAFCASAHAQFTAMLSFDSGSGIASGSSVPLISFKLGGHLPTSTAQGSIAVAGRPDFGPVTFYKNVDQSSPQLFIACATAKRIKNAILTVYSNSDVGQIPVFQVALGPVLISAVNDDSTNSEGGVPVESFSLVYQRIGWKYIPASGPVVQSAYDITKGISIPYSSITGAGAP